jgi:hypothetical protein
VGVRRSKGDGRELVAREGRWGKKKKKKKGKGESGEG